MAANPSHVMWKSMKSLGWGWRPKWRWRHWSWHGRWCLCTKPICHCALAFSHEYVEHESGRKGAARRKQVAALFEELQGLCAVHACEFEALLIRAALFSG